MARRYMSVSCNGVHVRTFGGNGSAVRHMYRYYKHMTKKQFLSKHPYFAEICKDEFAINVWYSGNPETCEIHIIDRKNKMQVVKSGFKTFYEANLWALKNLPENEVRLWGQGWDNYKSFRYWVTSW